MFSPLHIIALPSGAFINLSSVQGVYPANDGALLIQYIGEEHAQRLSGHDAAHLEQRLRSLVELSDADITYGLTGLVRPIR